VCTQRHRCIFRQDRDQAVCVTEEEADGGAHAEHSH